MAPCHCQAFESDRPIVCDPLGWSRYCLVKLAVLFDYFSAFTTYSLYMWRWYPVQKLFVLFSDLQRLALPLVPTQNGLCFVPIYLERPLEPQLACVDIILHKATDEIVSVSNVQAATVAERIEFSDGIQRLERYGIHSSLSFSASPNCEQPLRVFLAYATISLSSC